MISIPIRNAPKMTLPNDKKYQAILISDCPCLVLIPDTIITLVIISTTNEKRDIVIMPKKSFSFLTQRCRGGAQGRREKGCTCLLSCLLPSLVVIKILTLSIVVLYFLGQPLKRTPQLAINVPIISLLTVRSISSLRKSQITKQDRKKPIWTQTNMSPGCLQAGCQPPGSSVFNLMVTDEN